MANSYMVYGIVRDAAVKVRGSVEVTPAVATAGTLDIAALPAYNGWIVAVFRAGVDVTADAVVTQMGGMLKIANGTTFHLTAGDIVNTIVF